MNRQLSKLRGTLSGVGDIHCGIPDMHEAAILNPAHESDRQKLAAAGIRIDGASGSDNLVVMNPGAHDLFVRFNGKSGNTLILGKQARVAGALGFECDGNVASIGDRCSLAKFNSTMRGGESVLVIGSDCTSNGINFGLLGPNVSIVVGDDCMFSWGIEVRTTDSHAIIDIDTRAQLNFPESVVIESHVWIGMDCIVQKGTRIGAGSVVGARAMVNADVPRHCVVAGAPARVVRERATWTRAAIASEADISAVLDNH